MKENVKEIGWLKKQIWKFFDKWNLKQNLTIVKKNAKQ